MSDDDVLTRISVSYAPEPESAAEKMFGGKASLYVDGERVTEATDIIMVKDNDEYWNLTGRSCAAGFEREPSVVVVDDLQRAPSEMFRELFDKFLAESPYVVDKEHATCDFHEIISDGHRIDLTRVLTVNDPGEPGWDLDESRRLGVMVFREV